MKQIEVIVSPKGQLQITAQGYAGTSCAEATKFLEEALGTVTRDELTEDYYRNENNQLSVNQ